MKHQPISARRPLRSRRVPAARPNPAGPSVNDTREPLRQALRLSRDLADAGAEPLQRKRLLLGGLCDVVRADRGLLAVTRTDLATGRQTVISVLAVRAIARPTSRRTSARRPSPEAPACAGDGAFLPIDPALVEPDVTTGNRRCLDDFVWLDGLKLTACITLFRPAGDRPFDVADRSLVEAIHEQSAWVYAHDRHVARVAGDLDDVGRVVLQEMMAGRDAQAVAERWRWPLGQVRSSMSAVLDRLGASSRDVLVARWAVAG